jgi:hypothetical protein
MNEDAGSPPDAPATALIAWCESDRSLAVLPADREIIESSMALRALILDLAVSSSSGPPEDELYDACAMLGRLIAERHGSPTLASVTLDHASLALGSRGAPWIPAARAAVVEGFAAALVEGARSEALRSWEFPRCTVPLRDAAGEGPTIAIAANYPSDDTEAVAEWAAGVAQAAALGGIRKAFVSGGARGALIDALGIVGIKVGG